MMLMPTAYLDNLIGKTVISTQFEIQIALMAYNSLLNDLVPGHFSSKFVKRYEKRFCLNRRLVSSVGRAPDCCAEGLGFEPQTGLTLRVLKKTEENILLLQ